MKPHSTSCDLAVLPYQLVQACARSQAVAWALTLTTPPHADQFGPSCG